MNKTVAVFTLTLATVLTACTFGGKATPSPSNLSARIDTLVQARMNAGKLPGLSLVVVKDGEVRYTKGYGFANLEQQTAMTQHTRIAIGSTTKGMTALAVMQLVEQGKLKLDAPVVTYLPWFKVDDSSSDRITLRHLLAHTSGLPTRTNFDGNRDPNALERHVRTLSSSKLHRAPGSGFEYANDGYAVAGLVVQVVSGMPYAEYMTKFVFTPLGMTTKVSSEVRWCSIAGMKTLKGNGTHWTLKQPPTRSSRSTISIKRTRSQFVSRDGSIVD